MFADLTFNDMANEPVIDGILATTYWFEPFSVNPLYPLRLFGVGELTSVQ